MNYKKFEEKSSLDKLQYFITIIIIVLFFVSLIPFIYDNSFFSNISILILLQLLISIFRARILNVVIGVIILILSFLSLIPLLGILFKIITIGILFYESYLFSKHSVYQNSSLILNFFFQSKIKQKSKNKIKAKKIPKKQKSKKSKNKIIDVEVKVKE
jgi:signal transduction histidine kinase